MITNSFAHFSHVTNHFRKSVDSISVAIRDISVSVGVEVFAEKASGWRNKRCSTSVLTSPSSPAELGYRSNSSNIPQRAVCAANCAGELLPPKTIHPPTKLLCKMVL